MVKLPLPLVVPPDVAVSVRSYMTEAWAALGPTAAKTRPAINRAPSFGLNITSPRIKYGRIADYLSTWNSSDGKALGGLFQPLIRLYYPPMPSAAPQSADRTKTKRPPEGG